MSQGATLLNLQDIDLEILRAQKFLSELPEREQLVKARAAAKEVTKKRTVIVGQKKDIEIEIEDIENERVEVNRKVAEISSELDGNTDHRLITQLNRDLSGQAKRLEKLAFNQDKLMEKLERYETLEKQADETLARLKDAEERLIAAMQSKGSQKQEELERLMQEREDEVSRLDEELLERYEDVRARKNGIGVARLKNERCSACGMQFQEGGLARLLKGPEISTCPNCHRMIVVPQEDEE